MIQTNYNEIKCEYKSVNYCIKSSLQSSLIVPHCTHSTVMYIHSMKSSVLSYFYFEVYLNFVVSGCYREYSRCTSITLLLDFGIAQEFNINFIDLLEIQYLIEF